MEEIINNIMQSPEDTNPNVLRSQLQNISSGSGGDARVYEVEFRDNKAYIDTGLSVDDFAGPS